MPRPLSFDHLQAILRQHTTALPDVRVVYLHPADKSYRLTHRPL